MENKELEYLFNNILREVRDYSNFLGYGDCDGIIEISLGANNRWETCFRAQIILDGEIWQEETGISILETLEKLKKANDKYIARDRDYQDKLNKDYEVDKYIHEKAYEENS